MSDKTDEKEAIEIDDAIEEQKRMVKEQVEAVEAAALDLQTLRTELRDMVQEQHRTMQLLCNLVGAVLRGGQVFGPQGWLTQRHLPSRKKNPVLFRATNLFKKRTIFLQFAHKPYTIFKIDFLLSFLGKTNKQNHCYKYFQCIAIAMRPGNYVYWSDSWPWAEIWKQEIY